MQISLCAACGLQQSRLTCSCRPDTLFEEANYQENAWHKPIGRKMVETLEFCLKKKITRCVASITIMINRDQTLTSPRLLYVRKKTLAEKTNVKTALAYYLCPWKCEVVSSAYDYVNSSRTPFLTWMKQHDIAVEAGLNCRSNEKLLAPHILFVAYIRSLRTDQPKKIFCHFILIKDRALTRDAALMLDATVGTIQQVLSGIDLPLFRDSAIFSRHFWQGSKPAAVQIVELFAVADLAAREFGWLPVAIVFSVVQVRTSQYRVSVPVHWKYLSCSGLSAPLPLQQLVPLPRFPARRPQHFCAVGFHTQTTLL
eukprot:284818654_2